MGCPEFVTCRRIQVSRKASSMEVISASEQMATGSTGSLSMMHMGIGPGRNGNVARVVRGTQYAWETDDNMGESRGCESCKPFRPLQHDSL